MHYSKESPIYDDSHYYLINCEKKTIIGLTSLLDCSNVSVKTTYLNDNEGTVLYQRIILDNYKKQQPFILEYKFFSFPAVKPKSIKNYFAISCLLDAKLPSNKHCSGYNNPSSKPINADVDDGGGDDDDETLKYSFFKLDGVSATLNFCDSHFIVTNSIKSESFSHTLTKEITHRLKDFSFIVESELYESIFKTFNKPNPMAIIDLHTTSFSAVERINIITKLKQKNG